MENSINSEEEISPYRPFKYPPDYALARIHQKATMPGKEDPLQLTCPCCNKSIKKPFKNWWGRSIDKDFKNYGGGVVCYFWLLKLYCIAIVLVIAIYGIYLQYLTGYYCQNLSDQVLKSQVCNKFYGVWIVTNEDLYDIIEIAEDHDVIVRFSVLRSVVFIILLSTNAISLYLMKYFKIRYPQKMDVSHFALLFKNIKSDNIQAILNRLRTQFGHFEVQQAFAMKKVQPFYSAYSKKLQLYYQIKNEKKEKKVNKLKKQLMKMDKLCEEQEKHIQQSAGRVIVVFQSSEVREKILEKYKINRLKQTFILLKSEDKEKGTFFCEQCPKPDEIIWENMGTDDRKQLGLTFKVIIYYIFVLGIAVLMLFALSQFIYFDQLTGIVRAVVINIILTFVVVVAIVWRNIMDRLSDMRFPITYSERIMFIVITTVMLHFIFYLWIPSTYINFYHDYRGKILNLISNQAVTTAIVQIILVSFDMFFCCWNSNKKKVEDEENPYACQKLLHKQMEYPLFPFPFKMIVLYKFWSLITFFAYHIPMVLISILIALVILYVKDKYNLYFHYQVNIIRNKVQYRFLKIYTNVFTIYMYIIFVHTQRAQIEYIVGAIITALAIILQLVFFREKKGQMVDEDEQDQKIKLLSDVTAIQTSFYKQKYESFMSTLRSESIDFQIRNYINRATMIQQAMNLTEEGNDQ